MKYVNGDFLEPLTFEKDEKLDLKGIFTAVLLIKMRILVEMCYCRGFFSHSWQASDDRLDQFSFSPSQSVPVGSRTSLTMFC